MKAKKEVIGEITDRKNGFITQTLMSVYFKKENGKTTVAIEDERRGLTFQVDYKSIKDVVRAVKDYEKTL